MKVEISKTTTRLPTLFEAYCLVLACAGAVYVRSAMPGIPRGAVPLEGGFVGPFRGGTRAAACLLEGRFADAIGFNPLAVLFVFVVAAGALHFLALVLAAGRRFTFGMSGRQGLALKLMAIVAIGLGWFYVVQSQSYLNVF